jgi:hypothetical protein
MLLGVTIDGKALLDSALVGGAGALVLTLAFSVGLLAYDRARPGEGAHQSGGSAAWWVAAGLAGVLCIGIVALGVWAMTQK